MEIKINGEVITSLDQAIKLIQEAKEEKKGLWRPEINKSYARICGGCYGGFATSWAMTNIQNQIDQDMEYGNCFDSLTAAQKALNKQKALVRIKDYIAREGIERTIEINLKEVLRNIGYDGAYADDIIKACESDLKILFEI